MAKIWIKNRQNLTPINPHWVRRMVSGILAHESALQNPEVSILLLDDDGITPLNRDYLHRQGPTDVISFPQSDPDFPRLQPEVLGDIAISTETALRQARRRGCPFYEELLTLLIHGILHLLGHEHESSPADARAMRARERRLIKQLLTDEKIGTIAATDV